MYLAAISTDYRSAEAVDLLRDELRTFARAASPFACRCIELPDVAIVNMGEEGDVVLHTIDEIKWRREPYWWLSVRRCRACDQWWLVAQEERHNDVFCLRRLDPEQGTSIVDDDVWPSDFDTYEALLEIGVKAGCSVRFVDPLGSSSLSSTVEDLARTRPGIRVSEIARLLNLGTDLAATLAKRVVREKRLSIEIDV